MSVVELLWVVEVDYWCAVLDVAMQFFLVEGTGVVVVYLW